MWNKGTRNIGEQGNIVKFCKEAWEQTENFEGNTEIHTSTLGAMPNEDVRVGQSHRIHNCHRI